MLGGDGQERNIEDRLRWTLDRVSDAIRDADAKVGIIVAALAVLAAVFCTDGVFVDNMRRALGGEYLPAFILAVLIIIAFLVLLAGLLSALFPRMRSLRKSLIYFGDISNYQSGDLYVDALRGSNDEFECDLANQVLTNSRIAKKKMLGYKAATLALFVLVVLLTVFSFLSWR